MSDVPFDGWWLAANGRWYPPETHPAFNPTGPQAPPAGWFQDDEGNWLPPHLRRPDVDLSGPALSDPALSDPALSDPADGAEADELVGAGTAGDPGRRHRRKSALVAAWVMVVVLAGGIGIGYASTRDDGSPTRVDAETTIRPLLPPSTMTADETTTTGASTTTTTTTTVVTPTVAPPAGP